MTQENGRVIWITGLSGSGKTTLATELVKHLRACDRAVVMLDGDQLRAVFGMDENNTDNHGREGRLKLASRYCHLCQILASQGLTVVIATISLFNEIHSWNRANLPGYFEIYLKVPIEELRRRDPKGIYRCFDAGEIFYVSGLDLPIDEPLAADWVVEFDPLLSVETVARKLKLKLDKGVAR